MQNVIIDFFYMFYFYFFPIPSLRQGKQKNTLKLQSYHSLWLDSHYLWYFYPPTICKKLPISIWKEVEETFRQDKNKQISRPVQTATQANQECLTILKPLVIWIFKLITTGDLKLCKKENVQKRKETTHNTKYT